MATVRHQKNLVIDSSIYPQTGQQIKHQATPTGLVTIFPCL